MHTDSGLLPYLSQRFSTVGFLLVVLLAVAIAIAVGLALLAIDLSFAASVDPIQVAPVRWVGRF